MGFSKTALKASRTHFNRVAGQYRSRYGVDVEKYIQGAHTPKAYERATAALKFDVEQIQIAARVQAREEEEERKRQIEEERAMFEINNIKSILEHDLVYVKSGYAQADVRDSINIIFSTIDEAVYQHGPIDTAERLRPWANMADSKLSKLAFAIYDKYYNTNSGWYRTDDAGSIGRSRYKADIAQLAADLGVTPPSIYF